MANIERGRISRQFLLQLVITIFMWQNSDVNPENRIFLVSLGSLY